MEQGKAESEFFGGLFKKIKKKKAKVVQCSSLNHIGVCALGDKCLVLAEEFYFGGDLEGSVMSAACYHWEVVPEQLQLLGLWFHLLQRAPCFSFPLHLLIFINLLYFYFVLCGRIPPAPVVPCWGLAGGASHIKWNWNKFPNKVELP